MAVWPTRAHAPSLIIPELGAPMSILRHTLLVCCASVALSASATRYRVDDLGALYPDGPSSGLAINIHGKVVGSARPSPEDFRLRAVVYLHGKAVNLTHRAGLPDTEGAATGINASGQITGWTHAGPFNEEWLFIAQGGQMTLAAPVGGNRARPAAINASGLVVGALCCGFQAFTYQAGTWTTLPNPNGTLYYAATAVNDAGEVAGWSDTVNEEGRRARTRAYVWRDGVAQRLPTLGGNWGVAYGINRDGTVVGESTLEGIQFPVHAFLVRRGQAAIDLDGDKHSESWAWAVNALEQVVGERRLGTRTAPFIYLQGRMRWAQDLITARDQAVWSLATLEAINDDGVIVGTANHPTLGRRAVRLKPYWGQ